MRLRLFYMAGLLVSGPTVALTFQARMEHAEWKVEGDRFECRLIQPIPNFGTGEFVRQAGEQAVFRLRTREAWFGSGSALLLAAAAPWQPGLADIPLGSVTVRSGEIVLDSSQAQAGRLLIGLLEGRSPLVRHRTLHGGDPLEVRVLPVRFGKAYDDYQACTAKLLPVNYEQIRQVQLPFPAGGDVLEDDAKAKLEQIFVYLAADPSVNRFYLDGHSDNSGRRLENLEVSRRRALTVQAYLMAKGIPEDRITVRFHGERYPLVPNNSPANRAKNRRVTLHLEREAPAPATAAPAAEKPPL